MLAFGGIAEWERRLDAASGPVCLRVMRRKAEVIPLARARHLAEHRHKALQSRREQRRQRRAEVPGQLNSADGAA